ncbi:type II toxin-antitoxin system RelE/ParE family toxin [Arenimonas sp.]|uniref:type II toxin-antitoxin system RelE/ParE family toxin n=1 Tax=Arenimonas sp. TaxID=1872635 RepID=UPI0035B1E284
MAIQCFACKDSQALHARQRVRRWGAIESVARRKLAMLDAAVVLRDLATPPGNHLEALRGDRAGQHSIRINQQYRICFVWTDEGPTNVEIVDYH